MAALGGNKPRKQGNAVEREVAKRTGGRRIPMSGAVKMGNHNLTGDVVVPDADGNNLMKLEVKMSGTLTPSGESSYTLKKATLDQMIREATDVREIGALWLHFKNQPYEEGYIIMSARHWLDFLALAKIGATK